MSEFIELITRISLSVEKAGLKVDTGKLIAAISLKEIRIKQLYFY